MLKWYKSKKEVYLARAIWFGAGLISIYGGITNPEPFSYIFLHLHLSVSFAR